jgi:hypothetical protein
MVLSLGSLFLFSLLSLNAVAILNPRRFLAPCKPPYPCTYQLLIMRGSLFIAFLHSSTLMTPQMDLWRASLPSVFPQPSHESVLGPLFEYFCRFDYMTSNIEPTGWKKNVSFSAFSVAFCFA